MRMCAFSIKFLLSKPPFATFPLLILRSLDRLPPRNMWKSFGCVLNAKPFTWNSSNVFTTIFWFTLYKDYFLVFLSFTIYTVPLMHWFCPRQRCWDGGGTDKYITDAASVQPCELLGMIHCCWLLTVYVMVFPGFSCLRFFNFIELLEQHLDLSKPHFSFVCLS